MPYKNGVVNVGTTATAIATLGSVPENGGILVQNLGSVVVYLGSSTVTANTASTGGYQLAATGSAGSSAVIPTTGASDTEALCAITASSTANVSFLYPA